MSVLFTFPGQGAQRKGMLHGLPDHAEAARALEEASDALGRDVLTLDDAQSLRSTVAVQLCLLIAGVAQARVLRAHGCEPDLVTGLSIGAYPAAVTAGALAYADAVKLVELRGRLMERAYPRGYGMTAIVGLTQRALERLMSTVNSAATPVFLANLNAPTQMVIAGSEAAMQQVSALALEHGAQRCERLDVAVPSHCALLDAPAAELRDAFSRIAVRAPRIAYLSSSSARPLFDGAGIAADLAGNMAQQVRWHDTVRLAWERGARLAIEMPPAAVLTGLTSAIFSEGIAVSCNGTALPDLCALAERERAAQ
ncbi:Malonyl CoA acyl carrier protein transacylase [Caballeronia glathei]|jgi:malonate decarboxylase epsilon subunit|uniref:Malonyl CoA-acyl carrier protein transacylase n=1 Tax=Caballeronia glathei TaxID=60547 RepID=A0A069PK13_9BURK|nr:malonate decarboxylase subunit epsilon [Caballeronia glathei]KDR40692.1 malonate decarboxylase subunit epsilon [Caballeronia glathei]CDY74932.1 Malonyl CoA acyl carrier protein transacylase [Caballeronia glathei]